MIQQGTSGRTYTTRKTGPHSGQIRTRTKIVPHERTNTHTLNDHSSIRAQIIIDSKSPWNDEMITLINHIMIIDTS